MTSLSKIRHSVVGLGVRRILHAFYAFQHRDGHPVRYRLAEDVDIQLFPEGEIAEFLAVQWLFEKTEMALATRYLKRGMKVIDVGANIGVYSILAQHRVGAEGYVWAFEPSSESYRRLVRNISLNGCSRVQAVQMALSDRSDTLSLRCDPGFGDAYRYLSPTKGQNDSHAEAVTATPLDLYASGHSITAVDYMKVDVEGCEYRVFLGARELLASSPNLVVMFESEVEWCKRAGHRPEDTFELLRKLGFGLFVWRGRDGKWDTDDASLFKASTVWACRNRSVLPII